MSHDHGRTRGLADDTSPARSQRPSLDRPSLFAGMDPNHPDADAADHAVSPRLLSTLESAQRPARHALPRRHRTARRPWQRTLALGLMGVGALALLAVFSVVVSHGNPGVSQLANAQAPQAAESPRIPAPTPTTSAPAVVASPPLAAASSEGPLAALAGPTARPTAEAAAARIENVPPAGPEGVPPAALALASAATPLAAAAEPARSTASTERKPSKPTRRTPDKSAGKPKDTEPRRAEQDRPVAQATPRPGEDDVALVQAVMTHARTRSTTARPAPSPLCSKLSGAQAATCRARHCVQHPQDPVCHAD